MTPQDLARRAIAVMRGKQWRLRNAYRDVFLGSDGKPTPAAEIVLADLARFCRASDSSFEPGMPDVTALNEGKREVWNRVNGYLQVDDARLHRMLDYQLQVEGQDHD